MKTCKKEMPKLAARKGFRKYQPQEGHDAREAQVEITNLTRMFKAFTEFFEAHCQADEIDYDEALVSVKGIKATNAELAEFLDLLASYLGKNDEAGSFSALESAGLFISALINDGSDDFYSLDLEGLPGLHSLGYLNEKNVRVKGDLGCNCFAIMEKGKVEVYGDAEDLFGCLMGGGELILNGTCIEGVGQGMDGGLIVVNGDVGWAGEEMRGGKIVINGCTESEVGDGMIDGEIEVIPPAAHK